MSSLFSSLRRRVGANARRAVDTFAREVPEYAVAASRQADRAAILDLAGFTRLLALDRAGTDQPLEADDLAELHASGQQRAERGLSLASQRQVLNVHTTLLLREICEQATPEASGDVFQMVAWLGREGARARDAYLDGYLTGAGLAWSLPAQVELFTKALVADEPVTATAGIQADVQLAEQYLVTVVRVSPPEVPHPLRERVAAKLLAQWRIPVGWLAPDELVLAAPVSDEAPATALTIFGIEGRDGRPDHVHERVLALVRRAATELDQPCAVGVATGRTGELADPLELARQISRVTPPAEVPPELSTIADRFVELSVARMPRVDAWLRTVARALAAGPDLIRTLDAYYRASMSRVDAANLLRIHARTLDYRLQRVYELTGLRATSPRGIRILTATVARALAGPGH